MIKWMRIIIKWMQRWSRSCQFRHALEQGNFQQADKWLQEIQDSGEKLSCLEIMYRDRQHTQQLCQEQKQEISTLKRKLSEFQSSRPLDIQEFANLFEPQHLTPNAQFIEYVTQSFKIIELDPNLWQCTGIEPRTFNDFEASLAEFLQQEYTRLENRPNFDEFLTESIHDLNQLKLGKDPKYNFQLSAHVYLTRYFLENVYSAYLTWFLIYQLGLLPTDINILDIAAGPGTIIYGLALLLQSSNGFFPTPPMHISYYSWEQQKDLQYRGLQFWRKYMANKNLNTYFRFDTSSFFDYAHQTAKIPKYFFDFITISHCFFADPHLRNNSEKTYPKIFRNALKPQGYVILTIQDKKLWKSYDLTDPSDRLQELAVIDQFLDTLGLRLIQYKYLTATDRKTVISGTDFYKFARDNLSPQKQMTPLLRQYLGLHFDCHYALDDYVILAQLSS